MREIDPNEQLDEDVEEVTPHLENDLSVFKLNKAIMKFIFFYFFT